MDFAIAPYACAYDFRRPLVKIDWGKAQLLLLAFLLALTSCLWSINQQRAGFVVPALVLATTPALAIHRGNSTPATSACPWGQSTPDIDNGCSGSPGGTVQHSTFFTGYANQNGQTYPSRPQRNVAGSDYAVGMPAISIGSICGSDHMVDPANAIAGTGCGQLNTGCAYFATGAPAPVSSSGPTIYCTGATSPVVQGFDLRENGNHGAVMVAFHPTTNTGTLTVQYNWFVVGDNDQFELYIPVQSTNDVVMKANTFDGNWTTYGTHAQFTASISGTDLNVTAVSSGTLAKNQKIENAGNSLNNLFISSQASGTPGGIGHYTLTASGGTVGSQALTSSWQNVGCDLDTQGKITATYNAFLNFNGRPCAGQRGNGLADGSTIGDELWAYNYVENMVFTLDGFPPHGELFEGTLVNSGTVTWGTMEYRGNTCLQGNTVVAGGTTTCFYISTGNPVGQTANDFNTITTVNIINNVAVTNSNSGASTAGALHQFSYMYYTNTTLTGNWVDKNGATYYGNCTGAPYTSDALAIANGTGSLDQTPPVNTMHITAFTGPFNFTTTWHVYNYDRYITAILTGTGGVGTYTLDKTAVSVGSAAVKAQPDAFTNAPTISDNHDLTQSGASNINNKFFVQGGTGDMNNCMFNTH